VLIIFGLTSRDFHLVTISMRCEHCGNVGAHHVVKHVRKFSLFFIPLIPVGTRYEDTCTVCGRIRPITREQAESVAMTGPLR
jgi:hypothetical protein